MTGLRTAAYRGVPTLPHGILRALPSAAAYDRGMTRSAITSLIVVAALALAAPSFAASTSDWSKAADKICAKAHAEIAKLPQPTSAKSLIASTEKFMEIGKRQTSDLAKLKRPSGDASSIAKLIGYYEQQMGIVKSLIDAIKREDQAKMKKLIDQGDEFDDKAGSLVTKLGAKKCAS